MRRLLAAARMFAGASPKRSTAVTGRAEWAASARMIVVAGLLLSPWSARAEDAEVAVYSGAGMSATRPFTVNGPWEAQFSGVASFELMGATGELLDVMGGDRSGRPGTYYSPKPGTYYLDISAFGPWRVRVVEIK